MMDYIDTIASVSPSHEIAPPKGKEYCECMAHVQFELSANSDEIRKQPETPEIVRLIEILDKFDKIMGEIKKLELQHSSAHS